MAEKISAVSNISYDATRVAPVRGYTKEERSALIESVEKESEKRMEELAEKRAYLAKYPVPKGATFSEVLDQKLGKLPPASADDDEGYVLDIKQ